MKIRFLADADFNHDVVKASSAASRGLISARESAGSFAA